jgi:hypothetical protein
MVVLARAAGLPARIVMGFASGSYDVEQARYFVAENNAHAWVEIYFTGIGWVEFEPTASQPAIVYPEKISSDRPAQTSDSRPATDNQLVFVINHAFSFVWIPAIIFFILALLGIWWDSARLTRLEPVLSIQLIYRRLRRLARPISGLTAKHQTAHAYSFVLKERLSSLATEARLQNWLLPSREEINQLTELYSRCLFASASPTYMDARRAIKVWARLRLRLLLANGIAIKNQWLKAILPQRA